MLLKTKTLLSLLVMTMALGLSANTALAQCTEFPVYPLWTSLSHDSAKSYVKRKLKGDWTPYISHLEKQLGSIEKIIASGKGARLKHNGETLALSGEKLERYQRLSKARLEVVQCLAEEMEIAALDNFATAAGDEEPVTEIPVQARKQASAASALRLEVSTSCSNGVSSFKIKNQGTDWPKAGSFSIFRIDGQNKYPVSSRRMRLKNGQIASFTVKRSRNPTGNLGLFVGPAWYKRSFAYDATLVCL